jgi:hypothetical protein
MSQVGIYISFAVVTFFLVIGGVAANYWYRWNPGFGFGLAHPNIFAVIGGPRQSQKVALPLSGP